MKTNVSLTILLITGALLSSCSVNKLLVADFERDAVGSQPDKSLPADPPGDEIKYDTAIARRILVKNSIVNSGQKALFYSQTSIPDISGHNIWLTFKGASTNPEKILHFLWGGQHQNIRPDQYLLVDIDNGAGTVMARLYFYGDGRIKQVSNLTTDEGRVVGTINPDLYHFVKIDVNVPARKYNLGVVTSNSAANISLTDLPFISYGSAVSYANPMRPSLSFRFEDGENENRKYVIEGVDITQDN